MITGSIYLKLPVAKGEEWLDQGSTDRRALCLLHQCPDGALVIIDIGDRDYVTQDAARWIHDQDHRLRIDIRGTNPVAVMRLIQAARAGDWSVVA